MYVRFYDMLLCISDMGKIYENCSGKTLLSKRLMIKKGVVKF